MRLFSWLAIKDILEGGGGVVPTGNIDITDTQVTDVSAYATAQVVDADLVAENIKKDVNILGVIGTFEGGGGGGVQTDQVTKYGDGTRTISFNVKGEPKCFGIMAWLTGLSSSAVISGVVWNDKEAYGPRFNWVTNGNGGIGYMNMTYSDGVLTLSPKLSMGVFGNNINYFMDYVY